MTMHRRSAALAVCLLALAAGAAAQTCTASSFQMELVSAANQESHELAKCLSSATVSVADDCKITISAPASDNSFVPAMWSSDSGSYKQWKLCPATSSKAVYKTDVVTSIQQALNGYIYGFDGSDEPVKSSGAGTVAFAAAGKVTVAIGSDSLVYAIRSTTGSTVSFDATNAVVSAGAGFTATQEFQDADNVGIKCGDGRYGLIVGDIKLCPLCPAGTSGDGDGCQACSAGYASDAVGLTTTCDAAEKQCPAGTYAQEGSSNCLPCPMHTYSATAGQGECTACPANTYAWIPGRTACVTCANGVVTETTSAQSPGTAGSAILKFTAASQLASCPVSAGGFAIPAYTTCTSWVDANPTLKLALEVAGDCSITIKPITDTSCADPGAVNGETRLVPLSNTYGYTYNDLLIRAYYASETTIRTLLPANVAGASSFMLNINNLDADEVTLAFYAATNIPADSGNPGSLTCSQNATLDGGNLAGASVASCGAGSYAVSGSCYACPQGKTCASGAATECTADNANPYLGQTTSACMTCDHDTTKYTSAAGAAYCTLPYFDRMCGTGAPYSSGGYEWDESAAACVKCRPGTYRSPAMLATTPDCQECDLGEYSGEGAATCTPCPAGQYSPTTGMADQQVGSNGIRCLLCPVGSIALKSNETMNTQSTIQASDYRNELALSTGASQCDACPTGTWANATLTQATSGAKGCSLCPSGYYRIGDASAENNKCRQIPAGYKALSVLETTAKTGATAITFCEVGAVSSWAAGARTPSDATTCKPCSTENNGNSSTIAARTGMAACTPCKGGFYPNTAHTNCTQCAAGTFRSFYTIDDECASCAAGSEVGPSGRQACTLCRPGYYKDTSATSDYCSECPLNKYQATPGATSACVFCPKGKETRDTGNSECTDCPVGYYNPKTATQSDNPACIAAPAGTFVNTTGAFFATQCPLGTYNGQAGQDSCEPCAPGQYANTLGNKVCKTCPAGTYSGGQATTCKTCSAGYFAPAGSGACSPCKPGTYANAARSGTCTLCPKGKQCPTPATVTPKDCPAGSYSSKDGSILCTPCPVNTYAGTTGLTKCQPCASGTNTRGLTGQKACTAVRVSSLRRSVL